MALNFICECPYVGPISDIGDTLCREIYGLIVRLGIQRKQVVPFFDAGANALNPIENQASWRSGLEADDDTKIQLTPLFSETEITGSSRITEGGDDNTTEFGIPRVVGETHVVFTAMFKDVQSSVRYQVKEYLCVPDATVFMIDAECRVIASAVSDATGTVIGHEGFEVFDIFVGTVMPGGRTAQNKSEFGFYLRPYWDQNLTVLQAGFDIVREPNNA